MSTKTIKSAFVKTVKPAKPSTSRYQITFPKNSAINRRIVSLIQKFDGMDLSEIVKLALIKLDDNTESKIVERDPTPEGLKTIEGYLANPDLASAKESADVLNHLKKL